MKIPDLRVRLVILFLYFILILLGVAWILSDLHSGFMFALIVLAGVFQLVANYTLQKRATRRPPPGNNT